MSPRSKAPRGAPQTWETGLKNDSIEVESTPGGVLLRLRFPDGDEAGVEVDGKGAVDVAATIMFCALRHFTNPDEALEMFTRTMRARNMSLGMQAIMAAGSGRKPS